MSRACIPASLLALVVALAEPSSGLAQSTELDAALQTYAAAHFDAAEAAFRALLDEPRRPLEVSLEAHRHLAALRVRAGAIDDAREHARAAVAIDPRVTPPEGSAPEVAALIRASRLERDRFLQIEAPGDVTAGSRVTAYSRVPPEELGAALHLQCADAVESTAEVAVELTLPELEGPSVDCHASLNALIGGPAFLRTRRTIAFDIAPEPDSTADDTALIWGLVAGGIGVAIIVASIAIGVAASDPSPDPDP